MLFLLLILPGNVCPLNAFAGILRAGFGAVQIVHPVAFGRKFPGFDTPPQQQKCKKGKYLFHPVSFLKDETEAGIDNQKHHQAGNMAQPGTPLISGRAPPDGQHH